MTITKINVLNKLEHVIYRSLSEFEKVVARLSQSLRMSIALVRRCYLAVELLL